MKNRYYIVQFEPQGSRHPFFYGATGFLTQLRQEARIFDSRDLAHEAVRATEGQYQQGRWSIVQLRKAGV